MIASLNCSLGDKDPVLKKKKKTFVTGSQPTPWALGPRHRWLVWDRATVRMAPGYSVVSSQSRNQEDLERQSRVFQEQRLQVRSFETSDWLPNF